MKNSTQNKKILLVEDDNAIRRYIEVVLKHEGFEVVSAVDGLDALNIAFSNEIDMVLTDTIMPNLSGQDLCRMLRQDASKRNVLLVLMSGLEGNQTDNIADAYLTKDSNFKDNLVLTINNLLHEPMLSAA